MFLDDIAISQRDIVVEISWNIATAITAYTRRSFLGPKEFIAYTVELTKPIHSCQLGDYFVR